MEKLIVFILATAGLTWILCRATIFKVLREFISYKYDLVEVEKKFKSTHLVIKSSIFNFLHGIFNCYACMAFWVSQLMYIAVYKELSLDSIYYGFIGAITSLIIVSYPSYLGKK